MTQMAQNNNEIGRYLVIDFLDTIIWDSNDLAECLQCYNDLKEYCRGVYDDFEGKYVVFGG